MPCTAHSSKDLFVVGMYVFDASERGKKEVLERALQSRRLGKAGRGGFVQMLQKKKWGKKSFFPQIVVRHLGCAGAGHRCRMRLSPTMDTLKPVRFCAAWSSRYVSCVLLRHSKHTLTLSGMYTNQACADLVAYSQTVDVVH